MNALTPHRAHPAVARLRRLRVSPSPAASAVVVPIREGEADSPALPRVPDGADHSTAVLAYFPASLQAAIRADAAQRLMPPYAWIKQVLENFLADQRARARACSA